MDSVDRYILGCLGGMLVGSLLMSALPLILAVVLINLVAW